MGSKTGIEWTDRTWNPVVGCKRVSPGCAHCYAKALHDKRHKAYLDGKDMPAQYSVPFEHVQVKPERLDYPLRWRQPSRIFVNSVSDLFHEDVPFTFIAEVFAVMAKATQHTFQILTKRPQRMWEFFQPWEHDGYCMGRLGTRVLDVPRSSPNWASYLLPLPNVWLGTSVENQHFADERIPHLLKTPAAVRFLSCEPLLGPMDITNYIAVYSSLDPTTCIAEGVEWVIAGGESGPRFRPMNLDWARDLRDQCRGAGVAFFYKQGNGLRPGQDDLLDGELIREFPAVAGAGGRR